MKLKIAVLAMLALGGCSVPERLGGAISPWDAAADLDPPATHAALRNCAEAVMQGQDPETGVVRTLVGEAVKPGDDHLCVSFMGDRWGAIEYERGGGPMPLSGVVRASADGPLIGDRRLTGETTWYSAAALLAGEEDDVTPLMARNTEEVLRQLEEQGYATIIYENRP